MSYCRKVDGSDVYVFYHVSGYYACCGCEIYGCEVAFWTADGIIRHLKHHRERGDRVPESALKALRAEHREALAKTLKWMKEDVAKMHDFTKKANEKRDKEIKKSVARLYKQKAPCETCGRKVRKERTK